ncbi:MAG: hypothetical protein CMN32_07640 [Saprospirales bacterium]|nr:hypothetical protein [Saprospirales bacterium]
MDPFPAKPLDLRKFSPVKDTLKQYDEAVAKCRDVFVKKNADYGASWRILRPSSLTDQLMIKAKRIRSIEEKKTQKVEDSIDGDFIGIVNYAVMALIQLEHPVSEAEPHPEKASLEELLPLYDHQIQTARSLMLAKNHDYGEAWREMRISSITDLILMKLLRLKQIEDNEGGKLLLISEGPEANYLDIINYAIFALILLSEQGGENDASQATN